MGINFLLSLQQLSGQLASQSSVTDSLERSRIQSSAIRSGALFQNLGALMLELGRAMMTLRMGQSPVCSFTFRYVLYTMLLNVVS